MGYSFQLATRVLLYAPPHRQDSSYHSLCYTSHEHWLEWEIAQWGPPCRIHLMTHRTMSKHSYHWGTSRSLFCWIIPAEYIDLLADNYVLNKLHYFSNRYVFYVYIYIYFFTINTKTGHVSCRSVAGVISNVLYFIDFNSYKKNTPSTSCINHIIQLHASIIMLHFYHFKCLQCIIFNDIFHTNTFIWHPIAVNSVLGCHYPFIHSPHV